MTPPTYFLGLDLGQAQEPTALAVLERQPPQTVRARFAPATFTLSYLKRWPLGTSYVAIVKEVAAMVGKPPLQGATLVVDGTGVGAAVVDLFRKAPLRVIWRPVLITAGHAVGWGEDGFYHVAKIELVSVLQVLLQTRRLQIPQDLPGIALLVKELQTFRAKVTTAAANESFEDWREREHDDQVLAVALASFWAERFGQTSYIEVVELPPRDPRERRGFGFGRPRTR